MPSSVCASCRPILQKRLHSHIVAQESLRRSYQTSPPRRAITPVATGLKSLYWDTAPPTEKQLAAATKFFRIYRPRKLWTATEWRKQNAEDNHTLTPEVAFLGRSNVGKSSLLNAILGSHRLNHVGARPGKTTIMHAWGLSASDPVTGGAVKGTGGDLDVKVAVLDMPGYGYGSRSDWGEEIVKYFQRRKKLRRVFLMLDAVHGIKYHDEKMLDLLQVCAIPYQIIASKCDKIQQGKHFPRAAHLSLLKLRGDLEGPNQKRKRMLSIGEIIAVGALGDGRKNNKVDLKGLAGVQDVQWAILRATGLDDFAVKKLHFEPTLKAPPPVPKSRAGDGILQQALLNLPDITPPPNPSPPENRTARSATPSLKPLEVRASSQSRKAASLSRIKAQSDSASSDRPRWSPPSRTPSSSSSRDTKWAPSVGGLTELMELHPPKKDSGQQRKGTVLRGRSRRPLSQTQKGSRLQARHRAET